MHGPEWAVAALAVGNALLGMALGLLVSAFATSEFQAVQFMPAIVLPQLLLCGLFVERSDHGRLAARGLRPLATDLRLRRPRPCCRRRALRGRFVLDVAVTVGATIVALVLAAATLRRRTA